VAQVLPAGAADHLQQRLETRNRHQEEHLLTHPASLRLISTRAE
jgi:hypothetical protein